MPPGQPQAQPQPTSSTTPKPHDNIPLYPTTLISILPSSTLSLAHPIITPSAHPFWPPGHAVSLADVPPRLRFDESAQDRVIFIIEVAACFGALLVGILGIWMCTWCSCWLKGECFWEKVVDAEEGKGKKGKGKKGKEKEEEGKEGEGKKGKGKEKAEDGALGKAQNAQQLERRTVPMGPGAVALPLNQLVGGHSRQIGGGQALGTPVRQVSGRPAGQVPRRPTVQMRDRPLIQHLGPPPPTGAVPWGKASPVIWGEGVNWRRDLEFSKRPVRPGKMKVVGGKRAADKA